MTLGLVLLKRQQSVGIVDAAIPQVFDITETHARIETEDESVADILFLPWIMGVYEPLNLLLRKDILLQHLVVNETLDSLTGIFYCCLVAVEFVQLDLFLSTLYVNVFMKRTCAYFTDLVLALIQ